MSNGRQQPLPYLLVSFSSRATPSLKGFYCLLCLHISGATLAQPPGSLSTPISPSLSIFPSAQHSHRWTSVMRMAPLSEVVFQGQDIPLTSNSHKGTQPIALSFSHTPLQTFTMEMFTSGLHPSALRPSLVPIPVIAALQVSAHTLNVPCQNTEHRCPIPANTQAFTTHMLPHSPGPDLGTPCLQNIGFRVPGFRV